MNRPLSKCGAGLRFLAAWASTDFEENTHPCIEIRKFCGLQVGGRRCLAKSGGFLGDHEIIEVGVLCRGSIGPEQKQRATFLGAVRTMLLAGPDV